MLIIECCFVDIVIDHLDMLKKDNAGAREAIRWLEVEFQKGNRLVEAFKTAASVYQIHSNDWVFIIFFFFCGIEKNACQTVFKSD